MGRNLKGASWDAIFLAGAKILTLLFGIVLSKIMSMGLSLQEYGTYSQTNIVVSIGTSMILLGLGDSVNYFYNKKTGSDVDRQSMLNTIFGIELALGVLLATAIVLGRGVLASYFSNNGLKSLLVVASVLPALSNFISFYHILYVSVGKAKAMSIYNLIIIVLKIISAYIAVYLLKNILWIYVVLVLLDLAQVLIFKITLANKGCCVNPLRINKQYIKTVFAYGLPMGVYAMTSSLTRELDKLVIGKLGGTETLAIYTNCSKLLPFDFLVISFATVLIPYIVRYVTERKYEQSVSLFSAYMKIGYYSVWILGAAVLVAPKAVISFLYDDKYLVGTTIFVLYVVDSMLRFASMHLILTAANRTMTLMWYSITTLGLNLVLNIVFYMSFGTVGPAIATLVVAVVYTVLILRKTIRIMDTTWNSVFNFKEILVFLLSLACLWAMAFSLNKLLTTNGVHQYISMILCAGAFCFAALGLHFKKIAATMKIVNSFKLR